MENKNKVSHNSIHLTLGLLIGRTGGRDLFTLEKFQFGKSKHIKGGKDWFYYQMPDLEVKAVGMMAKRFLN